MTLKELATAIISNFEQLQEGEIIARIMIITGRSFQRSVKGYQMLIDQKLLPETFINGEGKGYWVNMPENSPIMALIERMDALPGKVSGDYRKSFIAPVLASKKELSLMLNLPTAENVNF